MPNSLNLQIQINAKLQCKCEIICDVNYNYYIKTKTKLDYIKPFNVIFASLEVKIRSLESKKYREK